MRIDRSVYPEAREYHAFCRAESCTEQRFRWFDSAEEAYQYFRAYFKQHVLETNHIVTIEEVRNG